MRIPDRLVPLVFVLCAAPSVAQAQIADTPSVVFAERANDGRWNIVLRRPGTADAALLMGRVDGANDGWIAGVSVTEGHRTITYAVAGPRPRAGRATYRSALWEIQNGAARRIVTDVRDGSRPQRTASGDVAVERMDGGSASIARVDARGTVSAVRPTGVAGEFSLVCGWRTRQVLLAVGPATGTQLRLVDLGTGRVTNVGAAPVSFLRAACSPTRNTVALESESGGVHVVQTLAATPAARPVVRHRGGTDALDPWVLRDGSLAVRLSPGAGGALGRVTGNRARRIVPMGPGSDAVTGETADGRWWFVRHNATGNTSTVAFGLVRASDQFGFIVHEGSPDSVVFLGFP